MKARIYSSYERNRRRDPRPDPDAYQEKENGPWFIEIRDLEHLLAVHRRIGEAFIVWVDGECMTIQIYDDWVE